MLKSRLFVVGQCLFLTGPVALGVSVWWAARTGNAFLPFLAILPYMAIALAVQLFQCPSCGERVFSLRRASEIGYRQYLTPRLHLKCAECRSSFWRGDVPRHEGPQ